MVGVALYLVGMAFLNRARGTRWGEFVDSDTLSRLAAAGGMTLITYLHSHAIYPALMASVLGFLYLWSVPAWGKYFAAVHGTINMDGGSFFLSEWFLKITKFPTDTLFQRKMWGVAGMAVRNVLIVPVVVAAALAANNPWAACYAASFPVMGLTYYVGGLISQRYAVTIAEMLNGAFIGALMLGVGL